MKKLKKIPYGIAYMDSPIKEEKILLQKLDDAIEEFNTRLTLIEKRFEEIRTNRIEDVETLRKYAKITYEVEYVKDNNAYRITRRVHHPSDFVVPEKDKRYYTPITFAEFRIVNRVIISDINYDLGREEIVPNGKLLTSLENAELIAMKVPYSFTERIETFLKNLYIN